MYILYTSIQICIYKHTTLIGATITKHKRESNRIRTGVSFDGNIPVQTSDMIPRNLVIFSRVIVIVFV